MTTDEKRIYNERAERLDAYRARIAELEQQLYTAEQKYTGACSKLVDADKALAEAMTWKDKWEKCETWRKAYQEAKGELYSMGGEIAEAAIQHMPCNEAMVDRWFRAEYVHKTAFDAVTAELAEAREDAARLDWLERQGLTTADREAGRERSYGVHDWIDSDTGRQFWTARFLCSGYTKLRAAIDAARKGKS